MNRLDDYQYFHRIETRWMDNDVYGHVNNVVYYSYFDTTANHYLIHKAGLDIHAADAVGFVVNSQCTYLAPIAYPGAVTVGLRVNTLGNKSVEYGLAIFDGDAQEACAYGTFTHVFVQRSSGQSVPIPDAIRDKLALISV